MRKLGRALGLFLILFVAQPSFAKLKVETYLATSSLEIGDLVEMTVVLESSKSQRGVGPKFKPPVVEGLEYQGTTPAGSGTMINYTTGALTKRYTQKIVVNYLTLKEGFFTVPAIDLDVPEKIKTKPLSFKVYKELPANLKRKGQAQNQNQNQNPFGSSGTLLDQLFGRSQNQAVQGDSQSLEFFTEVEVSKTEVFKGEQLLATWYIYVTPGASLGTFDTLRFPTLKGFWKEDVNFAARFYWKNVNRNGKKYMRALLSSYALTPYNSGSYEIDPFELRTVVTKGFFNARRKILKAKSDPIAITVKPLPEPVPKTFSGGVGRFKVDSVSANISSVLLGEPFEVSFRVVGDESTTKFLKTPEMDLDENFKLYKVKEDHKFVVSNVSSYKYFKYSLIPRKVGVYRFPDLKLSFLDANSGEYYDEYVKLPTYKVLPNKNAPSIADEIFEEEKSLGALADQDQLAALSFKENTSGNGALEILYSKLSLVWTLVLWVIFLIAGLIVFKKTSYVPPIKESLAFELEKRALAVAQLLKENKRNQALSELINILSLLVGAVNGKRFGAEKEIEQAVKTLPTGLKSGGLKLKSLNDELQEMRFGSSLESYTNKDKLETCLKVFKELFLEFREYLR